MLIHSACILCPWLLYTLCMHTMHAVSMYTLHAHNACSTCVHGCSAENIGPFSSGLAVTWYNTALGFCRAYLGCKHLSTYSYLYTALRNWLHSISLSHPLSHCECPFTHSMQILMRRMGTGWMAAQDPSQIPCRFTLNMSSCASPGVSIPSVLWLWRWSVRMGAWE